MSGPDGAAVVVTAEAARARQILAALAAQSAAPRLELIVAAPAGEHAELRALAARGAFARLTLLDAAPLGPGTPGTAKAAAVRAARAPLILVTETHCLPEPGWAQALLNAAAPVVVGVGSVLANANPRGSFSAAQFAAHFGQACRSAPPSTATAYHNTSFDREALLALGDDLAAAFDDERVLHERLRERGRFVRAPGAVARHVNASRAADAVGHAWRGGRWYGDRRLAGRPPAARAAYALAAPLILARRLPRELRRERWDERRRTPGALAALLVTLAVHSAGEGAGALAGPGRDNRRRYFEAELRRDLALRGIDPAEREVLATVAA